MSQEAPGSSRKPQEDHRSPPGPRSTLENGSKKAIKGGLKSQILVVIYGNTVQDESNEHQQEHVDYSCDLQGDA